MDETMINIAIGHNLQKRFSGMQETLVGNGSSCIWINIQPGLNSFLSQYPAVAMTKPQQPSKSRSHCLEEDQVFCQGRERDNELKRQAVFGHKKLYLQLYNAGGDATVINE
jgi:hypothetical protein